MTQGLMFQQNSKHLRWHLEKEGMKNKGKGKEKREMKKREMETEKMGLNLYNRRVTKSPRARYSKLFQKEVDKSR